MALDPQVEKILLWSRRARAPEYYDIGAQAAREHYARAVATLDIAPPAVHEVLDFSMPLAGRTLGVRQYAPWPHHWTEPRPTLVYFHGGGFTIGSLETHDRVCRALALAGDCLVFSVDYRLAPENRFPAAADDAFDAFAWIRSEAASLGVDLARLAVGGDSAGGTLAAACAIHARDQGWPLALQLLIYPGLSPDQQTGSHRRLAEGYLLDARTIQWFFEQYLRSPEDRLDWRFAPLLAPDLRGIAPAWIAAAEYDPLHDEALAYAQRLRESEVPVELVDYPGMIHSFFQHAGFVPAARRAHADAGAALRRAFADKGTLVLRCGAWNEFGKAAGRIRRKVFVCEQGVPAELEWDANDSLSLHCVACFDGEPIATGRLRPDGHIGRMAVLPPWRRSGVGGRILERLVTLARERGDDQVRLNAQQYVAAFYARHGFEAEGEPFMEAGIRHVAMRRLLRD
jgi:acetyl esterase